MSMSSWCEGHVLVWPTRSCGEWQGVGAGEREDALNLWWAGSQSQPLGGCPAARVRSSDEMHAAAIEERQARKVNDDLLDIGCLDGPQRVFDALRGGDVKLTNHGDHVRAAVMALGADRELTGRQRVLHPRSAVRVACRCSELQTARLARPAGRD